MDIHTNEASENILQSTPHQHKKKSRLKRVIIAIVVILAAALGYSYYKYLPVIEIKATRDHAQEDAKILLAQVGKLIVLPIDEAPTIFEINDPAALIKQQSFFRGSAKGDKVLIYQQTARAIIYSPSRNIIVNVGPVTQEQANTQSNTQSDVPAIQKATSTTPATVQRKK